MCGRKRRTSSATSLPRVPTKRHSCPACARQPATYSAPSGSAPSISLTTKRTLIATRRLYSVASAGAPVTVLDSRRGRSDSCTASRGALDPERAPDRGDRGGRRDCGDPVRDLLRQQGWRPGGALVLARCRGGGAGGGGRRDLDPHSRVAAAGARDLVGPAALRRLHSGHGRDRRARDSDCGCERVRAAGGGPRRPRWRRRPVQAGRFSRHADGDAGSGDGGRGLVCVDRADPDGGRAHPADDRVRPADDCRRDRAAATPDVGVAGQRRVQRGRRGAGRRGPARRGGHGSVDLHRFGRRAAADSAANVADDCPQCPPSRAAVRRVKPAARSLAAVLFVAACSGSGDGGAGGRGGTTGGGGTAGSNAGTGGGAGQSGTTGGGGTGGAAGTTGGAGGTGGASGSGGGGVSGRGGSSGTTGGGGAGGRGGTGGSAGAAGETTVYIGGSSSTISVLGLDLATGALSARSTANGGSNPAYLAWDGAKQFLYAANGGQGRVTSFSIGALGALTRIGDVSTAGMGYMA